MAYMFNDCISLKTIIVGDGWSTDSVKFSDDMFELCAKIKGGAGTVYDKKHTDAEYARIDGGKSALGYFTSVDGASEDIPEETNPDESYFDEETGTLHLKGYVRGAGYFYGLLLPDGVDRWKVEHIIAEEGTVLPEDCCCFCIHMPYLKSVDLHNADTSNVTDMSYMFRLWDDSPLELNSIDVSGFDTSKVTNMQGMFGCYSGTALDLSSFDTSNVTNMSSIFGFCRNLKSLDLSSFDTSNVTDMSHMFSSCKMLISLDISNFDTSNVTDMKYMFGGCQEIESLDISNFDTSNVSDMYGMFENCDSLETITVSEGWSTKSVEESSDMFASCENLKGGAGTVYDENHTDAEYARIDGGKDAPGYFTAAATSIEEDATIVIVIPEETMNAISYLYNNINNPTLKNIASTAINLLGKYFSIKIV
jgi:surface protein